MFGECKINEYKLRIILNLRESAFLRNVNNFIGKGIKYNEALKAS